MKQCPNCRQLYADDIIYCLSDGTVLSESKPIADTDRLVFTPPTSTSERKSPIFAVVIGLLVLIFIGGFIAAYISSKKSEPVNNSANKSSNNLTASNSTKSSNANYSSSATGRKGRLTMNINIRSASNRYAEIRGTHYENARVEILDAYSYTTEEGYVTWYKVRVLENGCDKKQGYGCGNHWERNEYFGWMEAEMEGWMNAKYIELD